MPTLAEKVIEVALRFVGQKESPGNNSAFADKAFQREMQKAGWAVGMSWCAVLTELIVKTALIESGRATLWNNMENLFSPGAVDTLNRFKRAGYTVRQVPKPGDLVVWRHGPGPQGHIGIVVAVSTTGNKMFTTVEGNTSGKSATLPRMSGKTAASDTIADKAIDRDGDGVLLKNRQYGTPISSKKGSFNLLGFIAPV